MSILLSIIVPVYNVGSFLPKCINSIISQTFTDFELILVDDGSTDNSVEICDAAAKKDSRVRVIHKENGVVSARKAGLSVAVGKYAGYVDGDDWIDEHMYEHMVNAMEKYNCDMVMCDVEHENKSVPLSSGSTHINISGGYYNREQLENNVFPKMIYTGVFYKFGIYPVIWNKLYKREKLIKHQMAVDDDIRTGEDAACVYPYLLECDSLYFLENLSLYHYRRSRSQMTVSYDSSYFDCFKSLYEFLSNSSIANSPYSNQLEYYYSYLVKTAISNELKKANSVPIKTKLNHIREICTFADEKGFIDKTDISSLPFFHRMYFKLIKRNRPFLLTVCINIVRFWQRFFR